MAIKKGHKKPSVSPVMQQADRVGKHMYASLTQKTAPKATPEGYILGACCVMKALMQQAEQQGADKDALKQMAQRFIDDL